MAEEYTEYDPVQRTYKHVTIEDGICNNTQTDIEFINDQINIIKDILKTIHDRLYVMQKEINNK